MRGPKRASSWGPTPAGDTASVLLNNKRVGLPPEHFGLLVTRDWQGISQHHAGVIDPGQEEEEVFSRATGARRIPMWEPRDCASGSYLPFSKGNWDQRQAVTPVWESRIARSSGSSGKQVWLTPSGKPQRSAEVTVRSEGSWEGRGEEGRDERSGSPGSHCIHGGCSSSYQPFTSLLAQKRSSVETMEMLLSEAAWRNPWVTERGL